MRVSSLFACCGETILRCDQNLVEGSGVFNPKAEILSFDFQFLVPFSKYRPICRNCVDVEVIPRPVKKVRGNFRESSDPAEAIGIKDSSIISSTPLDDKHLRVLPIHHSPF